MLEGFTWVLSCDIWAGLALFRLNCPWGFY